MDLREKKTKRNIRNAFLQLRAKKPWERISVKELAELAEISKATFYLHYHDIYELSDCLQQEVVKSILSTLQPPDLFLTDLEKFTACLFQAFHDNSSLISILFSGNQSSVLPFRIEKALKDYIFQLVPEKKDDMTFNIVLSHQIQGGYFAYQENSGQFGEAKVIETITAISMLCHQLL